MTERFTAADLVLSAAAHDDAEDLPRRLCEALCEGLPVDGASLSFLTDTPYRQLLCASGTLSLRLEELQFLAAEGPCVTAVTSGEPVLVSDFRRPLPRWPLFEAAMQRELRQVGAVYAFPLSFDDKVFGSVELLRHEPLVLDEETAEQAETATRTIAKVMLPAFWQLLAHGELPLWEPAEQIDTHWGTTHQATGRLADRLHITPEEALAHLRASAFVTGRPLPEIAQEVIDPPT